MKHYERIIVRAPNWIGDQVIAYPFFHYLRELYPHAHIAVLCVPWVESIQFRNLVDEVFVVTLPSQTPTQSTLLEKWKAIEKTAAELKRAGPWDLAITLPNSFSAAWIFYRAGAKHIRGYKADARSFLLHSSPTITEPKSVEHRAESYIKLLPHPVKQSLPISEFWGKAPNEDINPGIIDHFENALSWNSEFHKSPEQGYWVLAPGATAESRRWPIEYFAKLAEKIAHETSLKGIIIGGKSEAFLAEKLMQNPSLRLENWTQRGSVASYGSIFKNAAFTVCNDSGLAHIASLCGSRAFIIWGAGHPSRTKPLGPGPVNLIMNPVSCWPCEKNQCPLPAPETSKCIRGINVDLVWKEIQSEINT